MGPSSEPLNRSSLLDPDRYTNYPPRLARTRLTLASAGVMLAVSTPVTGAIGAGVGALLGVAALAVPTESRWRATQARRARRRLEQASSGTRTAEDLRIARDAFIQDYERTIRRMGRNSRAEIECLLDLQRTLRLSDADIEPRRVDRLKATLALHDFMDARWVDGTFLADESQDIPPEMRPCYFRCDAQARHGDRLRTGVLYLTAEGIAFHAGPTAMTRIAWTDLDSWAPTKTGFVAHARGEARPLDLVVADRASRYCALQVTERLLKMRPR